MFSSDPRRLAFNLTLLINLFFSVLYVILSLPSSQFSILLLVIYNVGLFVFSYFIIKYTIEKFVYEKIRLIYKTIHSFKVSKDDKKHQYNSDIIEKVNKEVKEWALDKKKEIDQLKKMESFRREFIGNVSHELKTPIFNIQGYILTLLDGGLEDENVNKEYLLRTEKSVNRMIDIIEDLDTISQLESGEFKINIEKFDLQSFTKEILEFYEIKARKKQITIYQAKNYERPIYVIADKEKIRQVLSNLIDNSIKYGNKKNGKTKVSFFDMDQHILVEVTDNGQGMSRDDLPRVFERFYRTDKGRSRAQGGTGLGLSIVKHIIEAHNQQINVRSTIGVGTTFGFTLQKAE